MRRVVITGIGVKSAVGNTKEVFWENLLAGRHGIRPIDAFDTSDLEVKLAAAIRDFDPLQYMDKKEVRRNDRYCQLAIAATVDAMQDCGSEFKELDPFRVGVIFSTGIGGISTFEVNHGAFLEKGQGKVSPFFIPAMISNMGAGMIAMRFGFMGANYCPVSACASSAHAVGEAFHQVKNGYLDVCVTGGAEAAITKLAVAGFNNMTALSRSTDPDRASIPFDAERNGFVIGEGASALILEEYTHAKARGAKIYAEIAGYGATADAYHITSPRPDGLGAQNAMRLAIEEAGLTTGDIQYINAHGTSTGPNDRTETLAIRQLFGEDADRLAVSSTKSMTGHQLGAAGAVETVVCALALQNGMIPPTAGYKVPDPECDLDYVTEGARSQAITAALTNSLGFGGQNASICLKKVSE
ncbi:MAG TPA: beta-ketoacyl-ACP synthase II [Firmicutes bacterium]|nr:beta-ketoacyl-ACP synthase II [Bacillota bacterium]